MSMKIVILVGLPLSGKSSHASELKAKMSIPLVETGTFVYKAVAEEGLEATPENISKVAGARKSEIDAYFTIKALEFIADNHSSNSVVFLSGLKARSEVELCKEKFGGENVVLITFHASVHTRHHRLMNKDRMASSKATGKSKVTEDIAMANDISRFLKRDQKELSYGVGELIALADFVINTEDKKWPFHTREVTMAQFEDIIKLLN